jgi:hypothetical protein
MRPISSPEPGHHNDYVLLRDVQNWCPPHLAGDVQIADNRVALPWRVVRGIQTARNIGLASVVSELRRHGHVLADDLGLSVVANAS